MYIFQKKEALSDIFAQVKDVDKQIFGVILEIFPKEKLQDCIGYLMDNGNQKDLEQSILQQRKNLNQAQNEKMVHDFSEKIQQIIYVLKNKKIITLIRKTIQPKEIKNQYKF